MTYYIHKNKKTGEYKYSVCEECEGYELVGETTDYELAKTIEYKLNAKN